MSKKFEKSLAASRTSNPIRQIVDQLKPPENCARAPIALSIGDPTKYGNMKTHESVNRALERVIRSGAFNGYPHSCGFVEARAAVARYCSVDGAKLRAEDVILTSGCSGALEIAIGALCNEGDNILLPQPGFSLYRTICESKGIEVRFYALKPEQGWQADLEQMSELVDERTRAILINNPSNPCGSVYSRKHLRQIAAVAERHDVPLLSDEIYAEMVFDKAKTPFVPLAAVSEHVPVISVGGIGKRFLVPGWRLGWILVHDRHGRFEGVADGIQSLTTLILGPNSLVQATLPHILVNTPSSFFDDTMSMLREHGQFLAAELGTIDGLRPIRPDGAMYLMVHIDLELFDDTICDDVQFAKFLFAEQNLCVLPGQVFGAPSFVRLVTCASMPVLRDAAQRFREFCDSHRKIPSTIAVASSSSSQK